MHFASQEFTESHEPTIKLAESEFWNDVSMYSISMIGAPGVPIPVHRTSSHSVTTGSEAEDRELRRVVFD